jgi:hypothetical protein
MTLLLTKEDHALTLAFDFVISEHDGSSLDDFNILKRAGNEQPPCSIVPHIDFEDLDSESLVSKITDLRDLILAGAKSQFDLAKAAIVYQTVNFTIGDDANELDYESLVHHSLLLNAIEDVERHKGTAEHYHAVVSLYRDFIKVDREDNCITERWYDFKPDTDADYITVWFVDTYGYSLEELNRGIGVLRQLGK